MTVNCPGCGEEVEDAAAAASCVKHGCNGPVESAVEDASAEENVSLDQLDLVELEIGETVIPEAVKQWPIWVLWDGEAKIPHAPWRTGKMEGVKWGQQVPENERPETDYKRAQTFADMGAGTLHTRFPFRFEPSETVYPTFLLPHEPSDVFGDELPLMYVDLDDVVLWEDGSPYVTEEVWSVVEALDGFTEISSSGEGLHILVRAELPGALGRFIQDFESVGGIELYDHGRFYGATWEHVAGTPIEIPERNGVVEWLVRRYEGESQRARRQSEPSRSRSRSRSGGKADAKGIDDLDSLGGSGSGSKSAHNAYYDLPVVDVARANGSFSSHERNGSGPHPAHGPQSGAQWADQCDNFAILRDTQWHCRWHGSTGTGLDLIAVCEHGASCDSVETGISDMELLQACITARDRYANGKLDDERPPLRALRAVATLADLRVDDDGQLSKWALSAARQIYDNLDGDRLGDMIADHRRKRREQRRKAHEEGGSEGNTPRVDGPKEGVQA